MRALLVALLAARTAAQCPSPYEGTSTDACFLISDFPATFSQCQQHCESNGGSLATIKDKAEDDYVRQLVTTQQAVWIGLFESGEQDESGVWEWVNGMSDTWRNWQPGEPNEWCTDEDCGLMAPGLWDGWVDASCTVHKIKSRGAPPPTAVPRTQLTD
jgi:C-type mannose receptor